MGLAVIATRLLGLASLFHRATIIIFGYFIPALSSVKAVVHNDAEAFFQWSTYWLILHLYSTVLSPILHFTLHPIFQLIAILWLSLPRFQGASFVYERVVVPWVKKYEEQVDDALDDAHRSMRTWVWNNMGYVVALVIGESGNLVETLLEVIFGKPSVEDESTASKSSQQQPVSVRVDESQSFTTSSVTSTGRHQPRHSVRDALRQSSSLEDFIVIDSNGNAEHSIECMAEYVNDFKSMMKQGLYVFANVQTKDVTTADDHSSNGINGNFRLCVFSYYVNNSGGAFLITPVGGEENFSAATLSLYGLSGPVCTGSQGIILEWIGGHSHGDNTRDSISITAEIVLSNEDDRDILFNCLTKCLPWMRA